MLDWASHTCIDYTTCAGEHFSLPAHGTVLVFPRILFGVWSRKFAYPSKELICLCFRGGRFGLIAYGTRLVGQCAWSCSVILGGSAGRADYWLGAVMLTHGRFTPT